MSKESAIKEITDAKKAGEFEKAVELIGALGDLATADEKKKLKAQIRSAKNKVKQDEAKKKSDSETTTFTPLINEADELMEDGKKDEAIEIMNLIEQMQVDQEMSDTDKILLSSLTDKVVNFKEHSDVPEEIIHAVDSAKNHGFYEKLPRLVASLPEDHPYKSEVLEIAGKLYDVDRKKDANAQKVSVKAKLNQKIITVERLDDAYLDVINLLSMYEEQQKELKKPTRHVEQIKRGTIAISLRFKRMR